MSRKKLTDMTADEVILDIINGPFLTDTRVKNIIGLYGDNREIIKLIVSQNGLYIRYLSTAQKNDLELVTIAVTQDGLALRHANSRFTRDPEMISLALISNPNALSCVDKIYQADLTYVKIAADAWPMAVCYASLNIRSDYEFMYGLILRTGKVYQYLANDLCASQELANIAVITDPYAIHNMHSELFTYELMFNTLVSLADRQFDIDSRINFFGEPCTNCLWLMMEAARMYNKRNFGPKLPLYQGDALKEYHPILDWIRSNEVLDEHWP